MNVKEKINSINTLLGNRKALILLAKIILSFSGGIICAVPYFQGSLSPFAASLPASLTGIFPIPCALGSILGIFVFQSGISAFRYFATVLTSTVILQICLNYLGLEKENLLRPLCPGICSAIVNFVFLFSQKFSPDLLLSTTAETALTAFSVPVFSSGIRQIFSKNMPKSIEENNHTVFAVATACVLAGQLRELGDGGEFICVLIFTAIILFFAYGKSFFASAVSSVCCATVYAADGNSDFMAVCFTLCGIICPLIKAKHRFVPAAVVVGICSLGCIFGEYTGFFPTLPAVILSAVMMCAVPSEYLPQKADCESFTTRDAAAIPLKAKEISAAVENLGDCVNAVRKTLHPLVTPDLPRVLFNAGQKICRSCEIKESCINSMRKNTDRHYDAIARDLEENRPCDASFPENFKNTCYHSEEIKAAIKQAHFVYCININSNNKISRFQEITGNQLKNFGSIIAPLCSAAVNSGAVTSRSSRACSACAEKYGIEVKSAQLCTNKAGHEYFNLTFNKPKENFNVTKLTENMRRETGFELDFPTLIQKDDEYTLIFKQKSKVSFRIAAAVKAASADSVSGDYHRSFRDSFSRQVVLLSDGMGTGTRAAVDSAFTCETMCSLLKAGLDVKTAVSTVNCAMLMKSTDESLATVDLFIADPVTAKLQIFKCGAAPSFILHGSRVSVLEAESTPIGILDKVDMAKSEITLSKGDIYLTVSDGIAAESWGWISSELKACKAVAPTDLAKHILRCACDRMLGKRADDMTVIVLVAE